MRLFLLRRGHARATRLLLVLAAATLSAAPLAAQTVRSATGATAGDAGLNAAINAFRADLGALNPNTPVSFLGGRREVNWDAVPEAASSPNVFPGTFFNGNVAGRARGILFGTPGTHLEVSANAGPGVQFGSIDPSYPRTFEPFSPNKLFTSVGSNIVDVEFRLPSDQTTVARTRGFGVVFSDVDLANTTSLQFFDFNGNLIGGTTFFAPNIAGDETFSFLGVSFADPLVRRVRITSGNAAVGAGVVDANGNPTDLVVMDDFIYAEPSAVPEPATVGLVAGGLVVLAGAARRRRAAA
jgi:hypothetical protein